MSYLRTDLSGRRAAKGGFVLFQGSAFAYFPGDYPQASPWRVDGTELDHELQQSRRFSPRAAFACTGPRLKG